MTLATENAARFATTREQWQNAHINAALADLDAQLRACRDLPGMVEFLDCVAARLEALGAK